MAVDAQHPDFAYWVPIWKQMRATVAGEEAVKAESVAWLPMPNGFRKQADGGLAMYEAYKLRAQFPDILDPTLQGMVGIIHRVEAQISGLEENKPLAYMWERCTKDDHLTLETFHRRITAEILQMGRYEILTDVASDGEGQPYFVGYGAEQLINWSPYERDLYVLDETRNVRGGEGQDDYAWVEEKRYRSLRLINGKYVVQLFTKDTTSAGEDITPQVRGAKPLTEIPLVVVGPRELTARFIDPPPLKGVSNASLAIYRLDADYRHQLFMSGQETLFIIADTEDIPSIVGAGVVIGLPANSEAKYVGPEGVGIDAHRQAIFDGRQEAVAAGVRLFDTGAKAESGEALRLRASAQTATLTTISQCSAAALEKALRYAAIFVGQNPDEIVVKPNLQFVDTVLDPQKAAYLMQLWQGGAMSKTTLYENLQRGEIASTERTFDEEEELIKQEAIDNPMQAMPQLAAAPFGKMPGSPNPRLNGSSKLLPAATPKSRFVETGTGLKITRGAGNA